MKRPAHERRSNAAPVGAGRLLAAGVTVTPVALDAPTISVTELLDLALRRRPMELRSLRRLALRQGETRSERA